MNQKPPVSTDEIATIAKDIDIFAGWLKRLENPDPVLRTEAAGKGLKLYDEIERDAHAGSVLQQRCLSIVGKEWEIFPAGSGKKLGRRVSTDQDQIVADYVSDVLENCNFDQARQEILKALLYGFYVVEVMWATRKTPSAGISIAKLIGKHPRRFSFTADREPRLLTPQNMVEGEPVPDKKFVIFTYGDSDNPYGSGLGRKLWWPVWFKKNGVKFWLIFLEKFGMPTIKGTYPTGTEPTQQQALMDAIEAIQSDTGIKIPDSMDIQFLEASRAGTVTHENLCNYMDKQISKAVLGQTATTEGTPGKLGNETPQQDTKQEIVEADADLLDGCLNDTLIRWIVDYNFPDVAAYPKIKTYAGAKPDPTAQSQIDKTLAVDIGLPIGKSYFYETYGIPVPEEGEELVIPRVQGSGFGGQGNGNQPQFAEGANALPDAADLVADRLGSDAMTATDDAFMAPLKRLVDNAKSMEEIRDGIIDLYGEMDPADLGALMERARMTAELAGRYEVKNEGSGVRGRGPVK